MFRIDTSKTCIEITICIKENQRIDKIKQGSTSRNKKIKQKNKWNTKKCKI